MTYSEELKHNAPIKKASVKLEVLFAERIAKGEFKVVAIWHSTVQIEVAGFTFSLQISNGVVYCEDESYLIIDFDVTFPCLMNEIHDRVETIIKNK